MSLVQLSLSLFPVFFLGHFIALRDAPYLSHHFLCLEMRRDPLAQAFGFGGGGSTVFCAHTEAGHIIICGIFGWCSKAYFASKLKSV